MSLVRKQHPATHHAVPKRQRGTWGGVGLDHAKRRRQFHSLTWPPLGHSDSSLRWRCVRNLRVSSADSPVCKDCRFFVAALLRMTTKEGNSSVIESEQLRRLLRLPLSPSRRPCAVNGPRRTVPPPGTGRGTRRRALCGPSRSRIAACPGDGNVRDAPRACHCGAITTPHL